MIVLDYKECGKDIKISPYNTQQEKEMLLCLTMYENQSLDDALILCNVENNIIETLTTNEKKALLYRFREISIGDEINTKFECIHCKKANEAPVNISNIIESANIKNEHIIDCFKELTHDNFQDFVDINLEELDVDEYEDLYEETYNSITKFNFRKEIRCNLCGESNYTDISAPKFIIDNMSEDSVMSLYQTYNDLNYYGNYTKQDIDTLLPFERFILISLLNKSKEEINR